MPEESWLPCPSFPGYEVSSKGRVKRNGRLAKQAWYRRNWHVRLNEKLFSRARVAYMVAEAFVGPITLREHGRVLRIHFRDGDPLNCRAANLLIVPIRHSSTADLERARVLTEDGVSRPMIKFLAGTHYMRTYRYKRQKEKAERLE